METTLLKKFATEARNALIKGVRSSLIGVWFKSDGSLIPEPEPGIGGAIFNEHIVSEEFYNRRISLQDAVKRKTIDGVVEEVAYTWFNRFIAIHIMAKNGLISPVLEYESENVRVPLIVSDARQGRLPSMDEETRVRANALLADDNKMEEQFAFLIIEFCHSNPIINNCFGRIADYTELLFPRNVLGEGNFLDSLNNATFISDEDCKSPELIGWLYQFYISERKDEVFANKRSKFQALDIPAATQIFTPNWIVKYMVQNTIGRIYLDNNPSATGELKPHWRYLVEPDEPTPADAVFRYEELKELKVADLACGSGHILNEFFDILFGLYRHEGYSTKNAIENIFNYNITGIDIDTRAKQLATFALLLKASQRDSNFADAHCMPHIYDMPRPYPAKERLWEAIKEFVMSENWDIIEEIRTAITLMDNADNYGSIMKFNISPRTRDIIMVRMEEWEQHGAPSDAVKELFPYFQLILALTETYSALVMNPPYMGSGSMNRILKGYVESNYQEAKRDLGMVFMIVAHERIDENAKYAMINMQSWMFIESFKDLRKNLLDNVHIENMLHLGPRTFDELGGEVVQNTAFVIGNNRRDSGIYFRLVDGEDCSDKEQMFLSKKGCYKNINQDRFKRIPGCPIGYWVSEKIFSVFDGNLALSAVAKPCAGLQTADNARFLRLWFEVALNKIGFGYTDAKEVSQSSMKWFPITKGGTFRRWYGNVEYLVNWENNGNELKSFKGAVIRNEKFYFTMPGASWSTISSSKIAFRYFDRSWMFEGKGSVCFPYDNEDNIFLIGYLNSPPVNAFLRLLSPALAIHEGSVAKLPYKEVTNRSLIEGLVEKNISISKADWDAHETSWDFVVNEIVARRGGSGKIEEIVSEYKREWEECFMRLHANEEELNREFIEIYGLEDELSPDVPLSEVTILQEGEISISDEGGEERLQWNDGVIVQQLISYAVGCMMGRYSVDRPGLLLANAGDDLTRFNELVPDSSFEADDDGIVPLISYNPTLADNATQRFKMWLSTVFGEENQVANLNYLERALGEKLESYFEKDFWKFHLKMYQNSPIYWLFRSNKGAFQCIAYMHRMNPYSVERIRTKYLLPHISWMEEREKGLLMNEANLNGGERRELGNLRKQIEECREYHERLHVVADRQIGFDLDDGVAVNYAKFGDVLAKIK